MIGRYFKLIIDYFVVLKIKLSFELKALVNFLLSKKARAIISKAVFIGDGIITQQIKPRSSEKSKNSFYKSFILIPNNLKSLRDMQFRFEILIWAMKQTQKFKDSSGIVECGVWYGVLSKSLINYFEKEDSRTFYLFDSWGEPNFKMEGFYKKENYRDDIFNTVKSRFANDNVKLVRGKLPNSLKHSLPKKNLSAND